MPRRPIGGSLPLSIGKPAVAVLFGRDSKQFVPALSHEPDSQMLAKPFDLDRLDDCVNRLLYRPALAQTEQ
jgi:hypothetical protein